ncbi:hypothetical protein EYF80_046700 [Liparis tanakae]|uniref:Uncharacterized protein n=1 Tax=Liparis tanakae TaxID=230148 RepID=A0A4Z2FPG2_9TELE|nr:hypothetical protein EYF80_046700 [Liparis tanakae]
MCSNLNVMDAIVAVAAASENAGVRTAVKTATSCFQNRARGEASKRTSGENRRVDGGTGADRRALIHMA